jgi:hypothetical protein
LIIKIEVLHVADVAVRGAELFSVKLPKASQHNFILSDDGFDLFRPCDQILEFASAGTKCDSGECQPGLMRPMMPSPVSNSAPSSMTGDVQSERKTDEC